MHTSIHQAWRTPRLRRKEGALQKLIRGQTHSRHSRASCAGEPSRTLGRASRKQGRPERASGWPKASRCQAGGGQWDPPCQQLHTLPGDLHASPGASLPILEGEPVSVSAFVVPLLSSAALLVEVMMIYSMVISRPSFHFDWGLSFLEKELEATGAQRDSITMVLTAPLISGQAEGSCKLWSQTLPSIAGTPGRRPQPAFNAQRASRQASFVGQVCLRSTSCEHSCLPSWNNRSAGGLRCAYDQVSRSYERAA